jgi:hypothetical protein
VVIEQFSILWWRKRLALKYLQNHLTKELFLTKADGSADKEHDRLKEWKLNWQTAWVDRYTNTKSRAQMDRQTYKNVNTGGKMGSVLMKADRWSWKDICMERTKDVQTDRHGWREKTKHRWTADTKAQKYRWTVEIISNQGRQKCW